MNHRAPHPATVRSPVIAMLLALASITACAQAPTPPEAPASRGMAVSVPDVFVSSDSEGFTTRKVGVGLYPWYAHGDRYTGLQVHRRIPFAILVQRVQRPADLASLGYFSF